MESMAVVLKKWDCDKIMKGGNRKVFGKMPYWVHTLFLHFYLTVLSPVNCIYCSPVNASDRLFFSPRIVQTVTRFFGFLFHFASECLQSVFCVKLELILTQLARLSCFWNESRSFKPFWWSHWSVNSILQSSKQHLLGQHFVRCFF